MIAIGRILLIHHVDGSRVPESLLRRHLFQGVLAPFDRLLERIIKGCPGTFHGNGRQSDIAQLGLALSCKSRIQLLISKTHSLQIRIVASIESGILIGIPKIERPLFIEIRVQTRQMHFSLVFRKLTRPVIELRLLMILFQYLHVRRICQFD